MTNAWKTTTFGTLGSFRNGINFTSEQEGYGLPVLKVKDFANHSRVQLEGLDELDPGKISVSQDQLLSQGDTVIIRSNGNPELVGRSMFFLGSSSPVAFSGFCIRFRPAQDKIDPAFAAYFLKTPYCRKQFTTLGTGTSITNLNQTILSGLSIDLPPLPEQRTIAHILGTLDDKIELNRQMNQTLEGIARALFQSWFVDFEPVWAKVEGRPTGLAPEIEALFPNRFVDTEMGPVPEGWEVKPLDQIANYQNGLALQKYPPKNERDFLPVIKIRELRQGKADDNSDKASLEIKSECIIDDGDVIFSWSGSLLVSIWCGGKGALNQHLFKVTSDRYPRWFYYLWTQYHLGEFQRIAADKATTMGHIKRSHLSDALVVVPPMQLISTASTMIEPFVERYVSNEVESRSLTELRDTLLPKLISGELRVQSF